MLPRLHLGTNDPTIGISDFDANSIIDPPWNQPIYSAVALDGCHEIAYAKRLYRPERTISHFHRCSAFDADAVMRLALILHLIVVVFAPAHLNRPPVRSPQLPPGAVPLPLAVVQRLQALGDGLGIDRTTTQDHRVPVACQGEAHQKRGLAASGRPAVVQFIRLIEVRLALRPRIRAPRGQLPQVVRFLLGKPAIQQGVG